MSGAHSESQGKPAQAWRRECESWGCCPGIQEDVGCRGLSPDSAVAVLWLRDTEMHVGYECWPKRQCLEC